MAKYVEEWRALLSDSDDLNNLLVKMGLGPAIQVQDVCDLHDIDSSTLAIIIVYPESKADEIIKAAEEDRRDEDSTPNLRFFKQTINNACGMYALIHAVFNTDAFQDIVTGSILDEIDKEGFKVTEELRRVYTAVAGDVEEGEYDEIEHHFTTFIEVGKNDQQGFMLVELDGERKSPFIRHTSEKGCIFDTDLISKEFARLRRDSHSASMFRLVRL